MTSPKPVRVRVAPSPTGHMHLGTARTALYDYLLARKTGGAFILRIEDTDIKRTVPGAEQEIMDGLRWLGLEYDEGPDVGGPHAPYRQTERRDLYLEQSRLLVESGHAYPCFCTPARLAEMREAQQRRREPPHYDGTCRLISPEEANRRRRAGEAHVIRFKMPEDGVTIAQDLIRGEITVENKNVDDYILLKSDGLPTYHLAAMVDDHFMGITHVLRGAEWLSTFPLHVNVVRAFGWTEPVWVHLSLFLRPSGKGKMSKRDGAQSMKDGYSIYVKDMQELGFIPEGVLNWCALMGWGVAEDDVMTLDEMVGRFDLNHLTPSPAAINFAKLDHFNGTHIRRLAADDLKRRLAPHFSRDGAPVDAELLGRIVPLIQERMTTLEDALPMAGFLLSGTVSPNPSELVAKGLNAGQCARAARRTAEALRAIATWRAAELEGSMRAVAEELGMEAGQLFGIVRVATTGQKISPPLFGSLEIIGRERTLERLENAAASLEVMS